MSLVARSFRLSDAYTTDWLPRPFSTYKTGVTYAKCKRWLTANHLFPPTTFAGREYTRLVGWPPQQGASNRGAPGYYIGHMIMHAHVY